MERDASTREFMDRLEDYLRFVVPYYVAEGKSYLTDRDRLHRRPPPLGDDRRAAAQGAGRRRRARVRVRHRDMAAGVTGDGAGASVAYRLGCDYDRQS